MPNWTTRATVPLRVASVGLGLAFNFRFGVTNLLDYQCTNTMVAAYSLRFRSGEVQQLELEDEYVTEMNVHKFFHHAK